MNDDSSGQNRFDAWKDAVADAVAFAERFPPEVRSGIVQALLSHSPAPTGTANPTRADLNTGEGSSSQGQSGIAAVALGAEVDVDTLQRFMQIADDRTVTIRGRLRGDTVADRQNAYSAVLAYVREKALDELDTESPLIHAICKKHGCLDGNLAANVRKRGWLLEQGVRGGNKSYRLSPKGGNAAHELIALLCADD